MYGPPSGELYQGADELLRRRTQIYQNITEFDLDRGVMKNTFPVLENYLNSFGVMQGGMIAAAIDNISVVPSELSNLTITEGFDLSLAALESFREILSAFEAA